MSDVNLDSSFNWSATRTGMEELRAFSAQTIRGIGRDMQGMFAGGIAIGAVLGAFRSIVDEASQIHDTAQRFRIDAQELQTIGNAAREIDVPLETVARAMNLLELNSYKATQAENDQRKALQALGLDADKFVKLSASEKILALSDAYVAAADKGAAYANIATLIGTKNTQLIPLLQQGAQAIREQGDALKYTNEQLEQLDRAGDTLKRLGHDAKVVGAEFVTALVTPILNGIDGINMAIADMWAGIKQISAGNILAGLQQFLTGTKSVAPQTIQPVPLPPGAQAPAPGEETGGATSSTDEEVKAKQQLIKLSEKLAKIERDAALERLDDGSKLEALERELYTLRNQSLTLEGGSNELLENQIKQGEKRNEIEKLEAKIANDTADAQERSAKLREQMADQADKDLRDSQELTRELQLELIGRKDLAERAKLEHTYDEAILAAQKAITKAEEEGLTAVANTNRALITQLSIEKQTALAAHDKARAEEMAKKAAEERNAVDNEKEKLLSLKEENILLDLKIAGLAEAAALTQIEFEFNARIREALGEAADLWTQMAQAYAEGNIALGDQLSIHAQLKQDEADELEIEKQKTEQLEAQNEELKRQNEQSNGGGGGGGDSNRRGWIKTPTGWVPAPGGPGDVEGGWGTAPFSFPQFTEATNLLTGVVDQTKLQQILLRDLIESLRQQASGTQQVMQTTRFTWFDQLLRDQKARLIGQRQEGERTLDAQAWLKFVESLQSGHPDMGSLLKQIFTGYGIPAGAWQNYVATSGLSIPSPGPLSIPQLEQQLDIMQKQLDALKAIEQNTVMVNV